MPTHYRGTPEEELALNTFIKLNRAIDSLEARIASHKTIETLTVTQFGVLEVLYHLGPLCQNRIGARLLKSSGNMTLVIDNLEKHRLVRRERNPRDRREVTIHLTPAGQELINRIFPLHAAAVTREMGALTPEEQETLGQLCKKLGVQTR
jgi:MarR family transcriptional regulator, 2-MHQ and catechol-resistance regulon repressor